MTTPHNASAATPQPSRRRPRRRRPGPFPVTIARPATTTLAQLTEVQRGRRRAADRCAAELTAAARQGRPPDLDYGIAGRLILPEMSEIIATAAGLAADPAPGTVRIGRDLRGRPVAVALHAETWSLLVRPARTRHRPSGWVFLDGCPDDGLSNSGYTLDGDPSIAGVEWSEMLTNVLTVTT